MPGAASDPGGGAVCLIVEDSEIDQKLIARAIRRAGITVPLKVTGTLRGARQALEREAVRLILLDNTLPDGRGADLALELSQSARFRDIPVALVTDWPSPFMFEKARSAGVREILSKSDLTGARLAQLFARGR